MTATLAHYQKPIVNSTGALQSAVVVRLLQPGTAPADNLLVSSTAYSDAAGTSPITLPHTFSGGVIDFYMITPQYVQLGVKIGSNPEEFYDWVNVAAPVIGYAYDSGAGEADVQGPTLVVTAAGGGATNLALFSPSGERWMVTVTDLGVLNVAPG